VKKLYLQIGDVELGPFSNEMVLLLKGEGHIQEADVLIEKKDIWLNQSQNTSFEQQAPSGVSRSQLSKLETAKMNAPPLRPNVIYKYRLPSSKIPTQADPN
jgi:hypothetical protein